MPLLGRRAPRRRAAALGEGGAALRGWSAGGRGAARPRASPGPRHLPSSARHRRSVGRGGAAGRRDRRPRGRPGRATGRRSAGRAARRPRRRASSREPAPLSHRRGAGQQPRGGALGRGARAFRAWPACRAPKRSRRSCRCSRAPSRTWPRWACPAALTGPVRRGDHERVAAELELLRRDAPELAAALSRGLAPGLASGPPGRRGPARAGLGPHRGAPRPELTALGAAGHSFSRLSPRPIRTPIFSGLRPHVWRHIGCIRTSQSLEEARRCEPWQAVRDTSALLCCWP